MKKQGMVDEERLFKPPIEHQNHGAKPFIPFKRVQHTTGIGKNIGILDGIQGVSNAQLYTQ